MPTDNDFFTMKGYSEHFIKYHQREPSEDKDGVFFKTADLMRTRVVGKNAFSALNMNQETYNAIIQFNGGNKGALLYGEQVIQQYLQSPHITPEEKVPLEKVQMALVQLYRAKDPFENVNALFSGLNEWLEVVNKLSPDNQWPEVQFFYHSIFIIVSFFQKQFNDYEKMSYITKTLFVKSVKLLMPSANIDEILNVLKGHMGKENNMVSKLSQIAERYEQLPLKSVDAQNNHDAQETSSARSEDTDTATTIESDSSDSASLKSRKSWSSLDSNGDGDYVIEMASKVAFSLPSHESILYVQSLKNTLEQLEQLKMVEQQFNVLKQQGLPITAVTLQALPHIDSIRAWLVLASDEESPLEPSKPVEKEDIEPALPHQEVDDEFFALDASFVGEEDEALNEQCTYYYQAIVAGVNQMEAWTTPYLVSGLQQVQQLLGRYTGIIAMQPVVKEEPLTFEAKVEKRLQDKIHEVSRDLAENCSKRFSLSAASNDTEQSAQSDNVSERLQQHFVQATVNDINHLEKACDGLEREQQCREVVAEVVSMVDEFHQISKEKKPRKLAVLEGVRQGYQKYFSNKRQQVKNDTVLDASLTLLQKTIINAKLLGAEHLSPDFFKKAQQIEEKINALNRSSRVESQSKKTILSFERLKSSLKKLVPIDIKTTTNDNQSIPSKKT